MRCTKVLMIATILVLVPSLAAAQNSEAISTSISVIGSTAEAYFDFSEAYLVHSFAVTCIGDGVESLWVGVRDCCMPGDHWEAAVHLYDDTPVDSSVCATGNTDSYRFVAASSGGNPLRAIVNVRYPHGINVFSAGGYVKFACWPSGADIQVTDLGQTYDIR